MKPELAGFAMPTRRQCQRALELHEKQLSALAGVVGLGIVRLSTSQDGADDNVVAVYVDRNAVVDATEGAHRIPAYLTLEETADRRIQVPVEIIDQGPVTREEIEDAVDAGPAQQPVQDSPDCDDDSVAR